ncbi:hypothetical protein [Rhizobium sp. BK176]|uniref:hypothetical protein n=1 Tax=Rhizobium sp. BK176 TaxID=2587071 RepID=UPI00216A327A|nr:hypothetical protein [Rhizobium sp. BK176]MCS4088697.1 hypothetical protein [Rhizobium sp. BK176]
MKELPKDFLTIGRGAEYVIRADDAIVVVSSGRRLEIATRLTDKIASNVVLRDPAAPDTETVIFTGSAPQAMQAYLDIAEQLTKKKRPSVLSVVKALSVSVASIAIVAALTVGYLETRRLASDLRAAETAHAEPQIPSDLPQAARDLIDKGGTQDLSSLKVLKKPDFLNAPSTTAPASEVTPAVPQAPANAAEAISDLGLPTYNPNLYTNGGAAPANEPRAATTAADAKAVPAEPKPEAPTAPEKAAETPQEDKATTPDPKPEASTNQAAETGKDDQKAEAKQDPKAFKKDAEAAVKSLIGNGMSDTDVRKLLLNLQQLNAGGEQEITPEMLRALPEEVAAMLSEQGMDLEGPAGGTMNILPSEVVDQFRGKDGVATIPENYSWYARSGGPVSIPLPGGGDIKTPDDFKDFGLRP